jgi:hypothetical protein
MFCQYLLSAGRGASRSIPRPSLEELDDTAKSFGNGSSSMEGALRRILCSWEGFRGLA